MASPILFHPWTIATSKVCPLCGHTTTRVRTPFLWRVVRCLLLPWRCHTRHCALCSWKGLMLQPRWRSGEDRTPD